jgi:hypothetical protein
MPDNAFDNHPKKKKGVEGTPKKLWWLPDFESISKMCRHSVVVIYEVLEPLLGSFL